jgi:multidrug efflux pump subunit AcrA (membrane-fusion protein)
VRLLGDLATAVVASGEPVWYTGDTRDMAPQVEDAVQAYVDEAHSKTVAVLPLKRPKLTEEEEDPDKRGKPEAPLAALIVEQIEDSRLSPSMAQRVEVVCRHSATALANSLEHESLFLLPLWRALGKSRAVVAARTLPKTLSIGGLILAAVAALFFWPANFRLESKGTLEPVERRDVYAGVKGVVKALLVQHGDMVKKDQLLARLEDTDLDVEITRVVGDRQATSERIGALERQIVDPKGISEEERNRLAGERAVEEEKLRSLDSQLNLLKDKQAELEVRSPINGQVVTWDLRNRLIFRPVQRGATLLRVADLEGPWQLELHTPDNRMGHIAQAQQEQGEDLSVWYQLATDPGQDFYGTIKEVAKGAEVRGEEGNTVLIKVAIDKEELPHLRPGATVTAKVYCGQRSLGFVWFHDALAFIQTRILFRYF